MSGTQDKTTKTPWINHFHLVVPKNASSGANHNATGAAILMLPSPEGWQLPYARAENLWLASTGRIIALLRESLSLDFPFTLLRYVDIEVNESERWDRILFVLEPGQPLRHPPLNGEWIDHNVLQALPLALPEQRAPLLHYLTENGAGAGSPLIDPRRSPWARTGWFAAASAWIEEAIAEVGFTQIGPVEQLRNWSISCLLAAPTSAGRVYFKAAAALPLFVNEPALTQTLAELYPRHLPTPLKIDRDRHWMLMEDFGTMARNDEPIDFAAILSAYGKMQRDSARHLGKLIAAGCINRRLDVLASQIDPLVADPTTRAALTEQEYKELVALVPQLKERCAQLARYSIPTTLLHGDFHMGNVTQRRYPADEWNDQNGDFIFFDWTDAAIGFPFVDHFMLYFELDDEDDFERYRDAYLAAFQEDESPERLLEAWAFARPLCALHHSVSYLTIDKHIEPLTRDELFHGLPDNLRRLLAAMRS